MSPSRGLYALALACGLSSLACQSKSADSDVDRIVQGVAEGKKVTVTVHIAGRPGEAKSDHRVGVVKVEFDEQGALKTVHMNDHGMSDSIPAAGFRKVLVRTEPITIE